MDDFGKGLGCLLATLTILVVFFAIATLTLSALIIFGVL